MKIVDVCAFYAPKGGGVRTYIDRKLIAGPRAGHEIVVIAPGPRDFIEQRGPGARIRWMKSPKFPLDTNYRYFASRAELHAVLDEEAPDMLEASSPWRSAAMVADWAGPAPRALIAHADPLSAHAYRWFGNVADRATIDRGFDWYWRHLRRLDARFDFVVSAGHDFSDRLRDGGMTKVVTNPMGVDAGTFSPALRDTELRARLLADCGLAPDAMLLLGVGRHSPEKRWDLVVEAATAAAWDRPVGLLLVGDGHGQSKVTEARRHNPHIRLLAPIADRRELARLMASADALIHGCEAETFCFVAAEARASGLRLIVPDAGGAADHGHASGGYLYRSGSAASAAAAIRRATDDFAENRNSAGAGDALRTMDDHFAELFALYEARTTLRARAA